MIDVVDGQRNAHLRCRNIVNHRLIFVEDVKHIFQKTMSKEHARRDDTDESDSFFVSNRLDDTLFLRLRVCHDQRSTILGAARIQHADGNIALDRRTDRLRMKHARAEVGKFRRLIKRHHLDFLCVLHNRWIGGEDTVHVRPDLNFLCLHQRTNDRRRIV